MRVKRLLLILLLVSVSACILGGCADNGEWDSLGGGGIGEIQDSADTDAIDDLADKGDEIIDDLDEDQKDVDYTDTTEVSSAMKIEEPGEYKISGTINGQINVKVDGVKLFLDNATINNVGKKVINSDYDLIIILAEGTDNYINNVDLEAAEANAISGSGKITINGTGKLTINSTKSGIKADGMFYGLGGELVITAGTGHGISADICVLNGIIINIKGAAKDGIHAETDDDILAENPVFDNKRGYVYIGESTNITIDSVYGDGIQADTFVLIEGGNINISTLPTFVKATSSDSCYKLTNGVYSKVAKDSSKNYANLYQLSQSNKGIKIGEIDYEIDGVEYTILENTAYSLIISGGNINLNTTDDGLHTNYGDLLISGGTITISTSDDGVAADKNVKITGGALTICSSYEGIEGETIDILGGVNIITATDDGINASSDESTSLQRTKCYIKVSGGTTYVNASGDGIDSNGGVLISGGELYIYGTTSNGDATLDSETGVVVTGGILVAIGSSGMVETPATNSTQYCVSINLTSSVSGNVEVKSGDDIILSFNPIEIFKITKNYQSIVISSPALENGKTYTVTSGSQTTSAKISGIITKIGKSAGPGGRR